MKTSYQRRQKMTSAERKNDSLRRTNVQLASLKAELESGVTPCREFTLQQAIENSQGVLNALLFS